MTYTEADLIIKVENLTELTERQTIVYKLQEIGEFILQNCYFEFEEGKQIFPLWVEAYYYKDKVFPDRFCHKKPGQKNRFKKPYYHDSGSGGVDVCLSRGDNYYLSYLIKVSYDQEGRLFSQTELADSISFDKRNDDKTVLFFCKENNGRKVDEFYRIGLISEHDMSKLFYQEACLSSYFDLTELENDDKCETIRNTINKISIKKEDFVKNYLKRHYGKIEKSLSKKDTIIKLSNQIIGYSIANSLFDGDKFKDDELPVLYEEKLDLFINNREN